LLVVWLDEILFSIETRRRVPIRIEVSVTPQLDLVAQWTDAPLGEIDKPIKAVTYNDLTVLETEGGLEATLVFDV
jgi:SHS2 domain-containing protein